MGKLNNDPLILNRLARIVSLGQKHNRPDWVRAARDYQQYINLDNAPAYLRFYFDVLNRKVNALTWSKSQVYLFTNYWFNNIDQQCAILLHESVHVKQYLEGRLNHWKYIFDSNTRNQLEFEAEHYEQEFLRIITRG